MVTYRKDTQAKMTRTLARFGGRAAIGLLALVLFACHKAPVSGPAAETPATPVSPLGYAKTSDDAQVSLTLPEPIKLYPDLHARLYSEAQAKLSAFMDQAHKDRSEQSADGFPVPAYYHNINWKLSAQSARLVSLYAEEEDFEGGAHPNSTFRTLLWDKSANAEIGTEHLFAAGTDMKPIDSFLCHQIEAERSKRAGTPVNQAASGFSCPKLLQSRLILIPSTLGGKVGAIDVLFAPYDIAPYAEGPFEIRIPQSQLKDVLSPEFANEFAGASVKAQALQDPDSVNDQAQ